MNKVVAFFKESYVEMTEHVTWSKFSELQNHTVLVLIASMIFALVIFLIDTAFDNGLKAFYNAF